MNKRTHGFKLFVVIQVKAGINFTFTGQIKRLVDIL